MSLGTTYGFLFLLMQVQLNSKNVSLTSKMGSDLLLKAAGEKVGNYTYWPHAAVIVANDD